MPLENCERSSALARTCSNTSRARAAICGDGIAATGGAGSAFAAAGLAGAALVAAAGAAGTGEGAACATAASMAHDSARQRKSPPDAPEGSSSRRPRRALLRVRHLLRDDVAVEVLARHVAEGERGVLELRPFVVRLLRDLGGLVVPDVRRERRHGHQRLVE